MPNINPESAPAPVQVIPGAGFDDDLIVGHCGAQNMRLVRSGCYWQCEYEISTQDFECNTCGAEITVAVRRHVAPPAGLCPISGEPCSGLDQDEPGVCPDRARFVAAGVVSDGRRRR